MEIKIETGGLRLDKALSDLTELSRSLANEQIKAGQVLVNGQVKKAKYTVQERKTGISRKNVEKGNQVSGYPDFTRYCDGIVGN